MASINVSEKDFEALASAAIAADQRGDVEDAARLDIIARKANCALSKSKFAGASLGGHGKFSWTDVPSPIATWKASRA